MKYLFLWFASILVISTVANATEIPINIGVGPAAYYIPERLQEEDPEPFYGFRLHIKAVIDKDLIKKKKNKIPKKFHKMVEKVDEVRVGFALMPESIMIAPRKRPQGVELYGATWKPISLGVPIKIGSSRLTLGTGLLATYAYINTGAYKIVDNTVKNDEGDRILKDGEDPVFRDQVTHFLRPGMELKAEWEIKFSDTVLTSLGWSSAFYIPQKIGGGVGSLGMDNLESSIWRIHQAFFMLHIRVPFETKI